MLRVLCLVKMPIEIIDHDDLEFGKFLGAGAEGAVWAAWYLETPVAIKKTDSMNEVYILFLFLVLIPLSYCFCHKPKKPMYVKQQEPRVQNIQS